MADEYISKQRAKDLMGCCLESMKAEYKDAKGGLKKARYGDFISAIQGMIDVVGKVEAADVQPVKRGHWIETDYGMFYECSECGNVQEFERNFCYECGADMRGINNGKTD